jgi:hypothetical protein
MLFFALIQLPIGTPPTRKTSSCVTTAQTLRAPSCNRWERSSKTCDSWTRTPRLLTDAVPMPVDGPGAGEVEVDRGEGLFRRDVIQQVEPGQARRRDTQHLPVALAKGDRQLFEKAACPL